MTVLSISALLALLPAAILPFRSGGPTATGFWLLLAVAIAGPLAWVVVAFAPGWRTGFAPALWLTVAVTLGVFAVVATINRDGRRLAGLLLPYLFILGLVATIWQNQPERPMAGGAPAVWVLLHIALSLATYGVLTVAAMAGVSAFLQDRWLKKKTQGLLSRALPALAMAETLELQLLRVSTGMLALVFLTGMAVQYFETADLFAINHKTMFSLAALLVVSILLIARQVSGLRGRIAARLVMLAYLLVTLAYPGVKFVTDVIMI